MIPGYLKPTVASMAKQLPLVKREEKKEPEKKPDRVKKETTNATVVPVRVDFYADL